MSIIIFQDSAGDWRWQLCTGAGWVVAVAAEGYLSRTDCLFAAQVVKGAGTARIYDASGLDLEHRPARAANRYAAA